MKSQNSRTHRLTEEIKLLSWRLYAALAFSVPQSNLYSSVPAFLYNFDHIFDTSEQLFWLVSFGLSNK